MFQGAKGDSAFKPNDPASLGLADGQVVEFRRGFPDFNPFAQERFNVAGLNEKHDVDMPLIHNKIATQKGFFKSDETPNASAAKNWLVENRLVPHHDPFTGQVITVPGKLHGMSGYYP